MKKLHSLKQNDGRFVIEKYEDYKWKMVMNHSSKKMIKKWFIYLTEFEPNESFRIKYEQVLTNRIIDK